MKGSILIDSSCSRDQFDWNWIHETYYFFTFGDWSNYFSSTSKCTFILSRGKKKSVLVFKPHEIMEIKVCIRGIYVIRKRNCNTFLPLWKKKRNSKTNNEIHVALLRHFCPPLPQVLRVFVWHLKGKSMGYDRRGWSWHGMARQQDDLLMLMLVVIIHIHRGIHLSWSMHEVSPPSKAVTFSLRNARSQCTRAWCVTVHSSLYVLLSSSFVSHPLAFRSLMRWENSN